MPGFRVVRNRFTFDINPSPEDPNRKLVVSIHDKLQRRHAATYVRDSSIILRTIDFFAQGRHPYALVAPTLGSLAVLDLETGQVIATWSNPSDQFCTVDLYVPDPGEIDDQDNDAPDLDDWPWGTFGFAAGISWGAAGLPTLKWIDLTQVREGIITVSNKLGPNRELPSWLSLNQAVRLGTKGQVRLASAHTVHHVRP